MRVGRQRNTSEARRGGERSVGAMKGMPGCVTAAILGQRVLTLTPEEQTLPAGTAPGFPFQSSWSTRASPPPQPRPPYLRLKDILGFTSESVNDLPPLLPRPCQHSHSLKVSVRSAIWGQRFSILEAFLLNILIIKMDHMT